MTKDVVFCKWGNNVFVKRRSSRFGLGGIGQSRNAFCCTPKNIDYCAEIWYLNGGGITCLEGCDGESMFHRLTTEVHKQSRHREREEMDGKQLLDMMRECAITIDGTSIASSDYLQENMLIVAEAFSKTLPSRVMTIAPDVDIPFYTTLLGAVLVALKSASDTDILSKLQPSDLVILDGKNRCKFIGVDKTHFSIQYLDKGTPTTHFLRLTDAHRITPYDGNATALDGRGVRSVEFKQRKHFFESLLGENLGKLYMQPSSSVLIVCPKSFADSICDMELDAGGVRAAIKLLFPSSYYSYDTEISYAGNSANLPIVLKFAGSFSVARDLIVTDSQIKTLIIPQSHEYSNHLAELENVWLRKSLHHIFLINPSGKTNMLPFVTGFSDSNIYAWTKKALESKVKDIERLPGDIDPTTRATYRKLTAMTNGEVKLYRHENPIPNIDRFLPVLETLKTAVGGSSGFRWNIETLSKYEQFSIKALSAFKLLRQAPCPLSFLASTSADPRIILADMLEFIDLDDENAIFLFDAFSSFANRIADYNPKTETLCEILSETQGSVAVIIPQSFYEPALRDSLPLDPARCVVFKTPSSLADTDEFDHIIFTNLFEYDKLNPWDTLTALTKHVLIYDFEEKYFNRQQKTHRSMFRQISRTNSIFREDFPEEEQNTDNDIILPDIYSVTTPIWTMPASAITRDGDYTVEIERIVRFATGEQAYFTKYFSAYVFNESHESVEEKSVPNLRQGDKLIFTSFDGTAKDIVTRMIERLVENGTLDERKATAWRKATRWKMLLKRHKENNDLSFEQLSQLLAQNGADRHAATIRSWIEDGSSIVGPRELDTFVAIAKTVEDPDMLNTPESYKEACDATRSLRIRLLKRLSKYVVAGHAGRKSRDKDIFDEVVSDISKMSQILEIDEIIVPEGLCVPVRVSNVPIEA